MKSKYADAFCGMGGFSQAVQDTLPGSKCVWASDIDENAAASFDKNFDYLDSCSDIWDTDYPHMPDFDIIFGGFPCQGFSINGTGFRAAAGADSGTINTDDSRCYLYKSLVNILQAKQPKYFLFENVGGLTRIEDGNENKMIDVVVKAFEKCGYGVSWKILNASDFGVPQQRKRVYLVGMRDYRGVKSRFDFKRVIPVTGKISITDILQTGVDDKYLLKNFWKTYTCKPVKSTKFQLGPEGWGDLYNAWIKEHGGTTIPRFRVIKHLYDTAVKPTEPTGKIHPVALIYGDTPSGISRQGDRVYSRFGLCPTLATFSVSIPKIDSPDQGLRTLTPRECARLQGFPDSYKLPSKDAVAYKQIGNAVCAKVVGAILKALSKGVC
jgi:DNA (cytosine-5)-methyltransferase 1